MFYSSGLPALAASMLFSCPRLVIFVREFLAFVLLKINLSGLKEKSLVENTWDEL